MIQNYPPTVPSTRWYEIDNWWETTRLKGLHYIQHCNKSQSIITSLTIQNLSRLLLARSLKFYRFIKIIHHLAWQRSRRGCWLCLISSIFCWYQPAVTRWREISQARSEELFKTETGDSPVLQWPACCDRQVREATKVEKI